jgi:ABC-type branched-subunit amino acid transport system substrate-binding protein
MLCPRCRHLNERYALQCERCGLDLGGNNPPDFIPDFIPAPGMPLDGVWREDEGSSSSGPAALGFGGGDWLVGALGDPSVGPSQGAWQPQYDPYTPAPLGTPAWGTPTAGEGYPPFGAPSTYGSAGAMGSIVDAAAALPWLPSPVRTDSEASLRDASRQLVPFGSGPLLPALSPGETLKAGRYRILQRFHATRSQLAQGDEPPLLVAADADLAGERVLVQELPLQSARPEHADQMRRLIAQRLHALAQAPGTPRVLDQFGEQQRHFLVYELPSGDLLLDRIQRARGPLDEKVVIGYALQVLETLAGYERQRTPFIHGNISPANIVLRPSGQVVLIGFSPVLLMHPDGHIEHGAAGGVPGYAPPEQARGTATTRTDVFALCAVIHHAVTGSAPAPRLNTMLPPARRLNPRVSLELEDVLNQGLRLAAGQRYQSTAELRETLTALAAGRLTHVPEELQDNTGGELEALRPVRDERGRLVLPRQRATQNPLFVVVVVFALIAIVGGGLLAALGSQVGSRANVAATPTPNDIAQLFMEKGIGLSGGEFIFDVNGLNDDLKQQGARALAAGDLRAAQQAFNAAVAADQADPEAAIYAEDVQGLIDKAPFVTLVAAVSFADSSAARAELQGVFLAQHRVDALDLLPYHLRVRVLILNSGVSPDDMTATVGVLLEQLQHGNAQHLVGIIGWPESAQTRVAISALKSSGLPLVSPTATANDLVGSAANYFAMVPSDSQQATELADAAVTQLNTQRTLVISDPQDGVSAAMAAGFLSRAQGYTAQGVVLHTASYSASGAASQYSALAQQAQAQGDDLLFLACASQGCDRASISLAQAIKAQAGVSGTPPRILTTYQAYTPALIGLGTDTATLTLARKDPSALRQIYVTLLTDRDAWAAIGTPTAALPSFPDDYVSQFGSNAEPDGLPGPDATSILSYDAATMLALAGSRDTHASGGALAYATPAQVRDRLLQYDAVHPFVGVGGAIAYNLTGGLPGKSLIIAELVPVPPEDMGPGKPVALPQVAVVVGGKRSFCDGDTCQPS